MVIELRTFGALDLRDAKGRELRAVLAQPKRLALLSYLAVATPGPFPMLEHSFAPSARPAAVQAVLAAAYNAAGRSEEAHALMLQLEARAEHAYFARSWLARGFALLGDKDQALTWLERAYDDRDGWLTFAKVDPSFDSLRAEPRFIAVMSKMRLE